MPIIYLTILGILLYWIGGQRWAHTMFRDAGCTFCMLSIAVFCYGWHIAFFGLFISYLGFTVGDHDKFYWSLHGLVIALGMGVYAFIVGKMTVFYFMVPSVVILTYLVSRYLNRFGIDVLARGLIYTTIPIWFRI